MDDQIRRYFGEKQRSYLGIFNESEVYRDHSALEDLEFTSKGAERQLNESLKNHVISVEPHNMLHKVESI